MRVFRQEEVLGAAYHEAGHAVAAHTLGRPIADISMEPDEETLGTCSFAVWQEFDPEAAGPEDRARLEVEAVTSLAGPVAEELAAGGYNEETAEDDLLFAIELADAATGDPAGREAYLDRAHERAEALLRERWAAVQALAEALVARRRVDSDQARNIIETSLAGGGD